MGVCTEFGYNTAYVAHKLNLELELEFPRRVSTFDFEKTSI